MIDFKDYIGFVQLAVAFNFACVYFKGLSPTYLFEGLFDEVKKAIKESYAAVQNNCDTLSNNSLNQLRESKIINESISDKLKKDIDYLIMKIDFIIKKIDSRIDLSPIYFNKVCLILGLYSTFLLFILGDYQYHSVTNEIWPLFTIAISVYLFIYLVKEWLIFRNLLSIPNTKSNLRTVVIIISIITSLYLIIILWNYFISDYFICTFNINTSIIKYLSIFIPYFSFFVCFTLHFCSIIYARIKLYWMGVIIRKQEKKINQILKDTKIRGIQFN